MTSRYPQFGAVERGQRRFRRLVETASEGIWVVDAEIHIIFANARMAEMLGCPLDELIGGSAVDYLPPERVAGEMQLIRDGHWLAEGRTELVLRSRDGRDIPVLVSSSPLTGEDGELVGILGMVTDVTVLKDTERRLRVREEELAALFDQSPVGIMLSALDGEILKLNSAAASIFGAPCEELLGKSPLALGIWVDSTRRGELMAHLIAGGSVSGVLVSIRMTAFIG